MSVPRSGMVLAAGLGTRMRPITDRIPKPLVTLGGRTLLDHALDRLSDAGVPRAVVNVHYKKEMIARHPEGRQQPVIALSVDDALLETGGGILNALPLPGAVFYVVNADLFWLHGQVPALRRLRSRAGRAVPKLRGDTLVRDQPHPHREGCREARRSDE